MVGLGAEQLKILNTIFTPACLVLAEIEGPNNAKNKTILKQLSKADKSI